MDDALLNDDAILLVRRAVDGDTRAMRQIVQDLTPVIRASVGSVLSRGHSPARREARQEIEDVTQTVLLALFADRGRVLLQWDPERGRDLPSFVALLAHNETVSVLRSRRRSPWTEDPTQIEDLDRNVLSRPGPESEAISRDMLTALADAVCERLTPRLAEVFQLLFMEGRPVEEVCELTGMSADAVYTCKRRLIVQVREIFDELVRTPPTIPPPPDPEAKTGPMPVVPRDRRTPPVRLAPEKTGPMPVVPRDRRTPPTRVAPEKTGPMPVVRRDRGTPPVRRRAAGSSSVPPPPSEG